VGPKDNVPANVKSVFKPDFDEIARLQFTEVLPKLAAVNDKFTMIRSMTTRPSACSTTRRPYTRC